MIFTSFYAILAWNIDRYTGQTTSTQLHLKGYIRINDAFYDYAALGVRARQRRNALKLTQGEVAASMGVSTSFIGHIERGEKRASIETIIRLAAALDMTLDKLLLDRESRCKPTDCPPYRDLEWLLRRYR